ncbi:MULTISPECIES: ribosome silencing factor [Paenibacillus]|jgi:ribosome-associated protein|uniref:Ribosomal silencing factor RsfS n=1 Tax=Paenibacillus odorifer TaxID=189426 RepID=A0A1R0WN63_9BACL|nr:MULTISPECIES: ribosome silencing factor [Paenibacillus]AIQ73129.1 ribosomal silencing factor RsfS [Paenibacillus odorifer]AWV32476.1 ribosome silencing factor RsfS [Paenibacillus odorifer]ETT68991.1 iojap family protein [Paenibacillus sp. FSL H8-237]MDH6425936.1 ribosome-associated protein [Paenibacillus sp. PastH-4]MDH6441957.1 ribosome-associated protein [Paenibacillus sp. PastF-4]
MSVQPSKLLELALKAVEDKKAMNVVALDLRNVSPISDYFIVCHGNSDIQVQAIATEVRKVVHEAGGVIKGIEGMDSARWVLMDLGDVIVHIFHRDEREYYNIERLWSDAKVVETV